MLTDVLLVNFLEHGCTINGEYYTSPWNSCEQQSSRRDVANSKRERLLRDNAPAHKVAMHKTANCGFELLPHPLYSPDLATSDYHLFPNMKKQLGDRVFTDNEETMACVPNVLNGFETHSFKEDLKALVKGCEKYVHLNGVYMDK